MIVVINGVEEDHACADVQELWDAHSRAREIETPVGFAIAVNGRLVRRAEWRDTPLRAGDRIEIVRAFAGG